MTQDTELRKALSSLTASTGDKLIPEIFDAGIREYVEGSSPLYNLINKIPWDSSHYRYRSLTALPTAAFKIDMDTMPTPTRGTYAKTAVEVKMIYTQGEVSGPLQSFSRSLMDIYDYEIGIHSVSIKRALERNIVAGDATGSPEEFDGLITQITTAVAGGSASLTLSMLDQAIDAPPAGRPTHIITDRAKNRRINALLQAQQRFTDRVEIQAGFRVLTYDNLPILALDLDADDDITTTVVLPDFSQVVMPIVTDFTFEPLGKSQTTDSDLFRIKWYGTLAVEGAARYHSKITAVTA